MPMAIAIAGLAMAAGSAAASAKSSSDASAATQEGVNRQTATSHDQYDRRAIISDANFEKLLGVNKSEFDKQQGLAKTATDKIHDLGIGGNAERVGAANEQIARDLGSNLENLSGQRGISSDAFAKQQAQRANFARLVDEAVAKQAGYRGEADSAVDSTVNTMGQPAMEAGRVADAAGKNATAQGAIDAPSLTPGFDNTSALTRDAALRAITARVDPVRAAAEAGANVRSYGNMVTTAGDRQLALGDRLRTISTQSAADRGALPTELAPSNLEFGQAGSLADKLSAALAQQKAGEVQLSQLMAAGIIDPSKQFQSSEAGSVGDLGNKLIQSSADYQNHENETGNSEMNALNTASLRFENTSQGINSFKINSANQPSVVGGALSGVGSAVGKLDPNATWNTLKGWWTSMNTPTPPATEAIQTDVPATNVAGNSFYAGGLT